MFRALLRQLYTETPLDYQRISISYSLSWLCRKELSKKDAIRIKDQYIIIPSNHKVQSRELDLQVGSDIHYLKDLDAGDLHSSLFFTNGGDPRNCTSAHRPF